jgi:hypothetical protein
MFKDMVECCSLSSELRDSWKKIDVRCVVSGSEEPDRYATADNNDV